jgi:hypothetical protein
VKFLLSYGAASTVEDPEGERSLFEEKFLKEHKKLRILLNSPKFINISEAFKSLLKTGKEV